MLKLPDFAEDHPGLFMWLIVLPILMAALFLILWLLGFPNLPDPTSPA